MQGPPEQSPNVERVLEALYERAVAAEGCFWCACLARLCSAFDAHFAFAGSHSGDRLRALHRYSVGAEPISHHTGNDEREPFELPGESRRILCPVAGPASGPGLIGLLRTAEEPEFTQGQRQALSSLSRHLGRMALFRDVMARERARYDQVACLLERLPIPLVMLDTSGRAVYMNRFASDLIRRGDGLTLRQDGTIGADTSAASLELRRAFARLTGDHARAPLPEPALQVTIQRRGCPLPLVCTISRIDVSIDVSGVGSQDAMLAMMITDPRKSGGREWGDFAAAYQLTRAEARLVALLAEGLGLFEAAEQLGISRNTARTHMRSIHSKVGTSRQTDLVRLLERFNPFHLGNTAPAIFSVASLVGRSLTPRGDEYPLPGE
jgi:DNA-binding CsgD family transcriptional regulator